MCITRFTNILEIGQSKTVLGHVPFDGWGKTDGFVEALVMDKCIAFVCRLNFIAYSVHMICPVAFFFVQKFPAQVRAC